MSKTLRSDSTSRHKRTTRSIENSRSRHQFKKNAHQFIRGERNEDEIEWEGESRKK